MVKRIVEKYWRCVQFIHHHRTKSEATRCDKEYKIWLEKTHEKYSCRRCSGGLKGKECTEECSCVGCEGFGR